MENAQQRRAADKDLGERGQWSNKVEFLLAVAGNIIGLGNVWRFPYLCYKNGGGAFLIPYILFAATCGVPLFVLNICVGQYTKQSAATSWGKLCPLAGGFGHAGCVFALYFCLGYNLILAWALFTFLPLLAPSYHGLVVIISGTLVQGRTLNVSSGIETLGKLNWEILLCLLAAWVACYFCTWKGVKSAGKAVYCTAIFPYVMMLVLLLRGLTLPGALQGIKYYLYPQPSRLTDPQVWIDAGTQIFFSYSLGAGTLTVLASYSPYNNNCYRDGIWLCVLNSCTSFVAGFVVFSVLGFMAETLGVGIEDVARPGPGLAFITYPQAVAMMPLPQFWSTCFFIMMIFLVLDTQFVGIEVVITSIIDIFPTVLRKPHRRELVLLFFCSGCFCFQIILTTQAGVYIFHLIDYYGFNGACYFFMCLIEALVIGWIFGADRMIDIIEDMCDKKPSAFFKYCWRYFTPLMCLGAFILCIVKYQPLMYNNVYVYPTWTCVLGWLMTVFAPVLVITWGLVKLCSHSGTLKQRFKSLCTPDDKLPLTRKQRAQLQISETLMGGI